MTRPLSLCCSCHSYDPLRSHSWRGLWRRGQRPSANCRLRSLRYSHSPSMVAASSEVFLRPSSLLSTLTRTHTHTHPTLQLIITLIFFFRLRLTNLSSAPRWRQSEPSSPGWQRCPSYEGTWRSLTRESVSKRASLLAVTPLGVR